jgi:hypothetical protein
MPPALNLEEILRLHEQCRTVWRQTYDTLRKLSNQILLVPGSQHFPALPTFPLPNNLPVWKEHYKQAVLGMMPLVVGMGLYLHLRRDKNEMHEIIQKASRTAIPS